ncbi:probable RNA-dependent RNA polymerase 1 [Ananas comosus]|uniref:RNA-dependent RNA polymerase n=1 Tax=Ananas comosus TaxID=4615 RepID=A0A6P5F1B3_ANACO|nr:probable RNA-dependent RNA polymerase 1 [Ananas comosus]XP_020089661.1 probable RNA-dependent RNA polymerase 1 [Ananas comosus]
MGGKTVNIHGFPLHASADYAKNILEGFISDGSVYALKLRQPKVTTGKSRSYAVVQFLTEGQAKQIIYLADNSLLRCQGYYLKARYMERDIVPKPRSSLFVVERATLHFGCPVSKRSFCVLWSASDVHVNFGFNLRKIYFFLSKGSFEYKLELSYESIWEIQLHRSSDQGSQFLLFQMAAAPKIYELPLRSSSLVQEDPLLNYFKETPDDKWIRSTDFSPSCSMGQSSVICLQLPYDYELPNIREYFVFYEEFNGHYELNRGSSYSCNVELVPIVEPHPLIQVPYNILFKINQMVQNGTISGPTLDDEFFRLVSPYLVPVDYIVHAIEKMSCFKKTCLDPAIWLSKQYLKYKQSDCPPKSPRISLDDGLVYVHRVQVTPSKVYFCGPEVNVSNRVLRHFSDEMNNFLRVSFVDEDCEKMRSTDLSPRSGSSNGARHTALYKRILSVLRNGIAIGNKKFEFLAFSSSQLRDNSAWMFASGIEMTASDIRQWMGDFRSIRNVAKYAARLGQSFSSSTETLSVGRHEVDIIDDVYNGTSCCFSDGIGKISADFARRVAAKYGLKSSTPSAFQIRYGGYKGVVAVDPTSSKKLSLRKSMSKYESTNTKLDVLAYTKYQPCFLNRQLITLLSTLGIRDSIFEVKQEAAVNQLDKILTDPEMAYEAVELMSPGETTNVLKELLLCGYKPNREPFLSMLLQAFRATRLLELRTKLRIFVPKGRAMMGCLDETRKLEYGQVFVQISCTGSSQFQNNGLYMFAESESDDHTVVVKGKVVVAKNPCLHPGDVRVLMAVDVPALRHMVDCVVFPQKGKRPHPNECSGSDLDGDIYFVCWDPTLIPPCMVSPMDYTQAPTETLDHDVSIEEVMEYFTNYIVNDSLGIIANAHTVCADKEPLKALSQACVELAKLFSIAVDFPKTGVPAEIPQHLHVKEYPDFMEKLDKVTYESKGVIGRLYRAIKESTPQSDSIKKFTKEAARRSYDPDMEVDGFSDYLDEASSFKDDYDFKLGNLMDHYGIKTEAEILSGSILKMGKTFTKYKDGEAIRLAVKSLRKEARSWFKDMSGDNDQSEDDLYAKASAWYYVTYHPDYWGRYNEGLDRPHFLSFPWSVYDKLVIIKQKKIEMRKRQAELSSWMEQGLRIF